MFAMLYIIYSKSVFKVLFWLITIYINISNDKVPLFQFFFIKIDKLLFAFERLLHAIHSIAASIMIGFADFVYNIWMFEDSICANLVVHVYL